jgi:hypothetical protein
MTCPFQRSAKKDVVLHLAQTDFPSSQRRRLI